MDGTTRDKFFDAFNDWSDALLTAIEATEARRYTLSKAAIDEARTGEKEVRALARRWADAPTNVFENLEAMLKVQARAQRRVLKLARDALGGVREYGTDVQDAFRQVIKANVKAGEATVDVAREAYTRVRGSEGSESGGRRRAKATRVPVTAGASTNSGPDSTHD